MITDLIAHSGKGDQFSPEVEAAYAILKDFMYSTVYADKEAKQRGKSKGGRFISELYTRLSDEPALMPPFICRPRLQRGR